MRSIPMSLQVAFVVSLFAVLIPSMPRAEWLTEVRQALERGRTTQTVGPLEEARGILEPRADAHDVDGRAHYYLARTLSELGAHFAAEGHAERATRLFDEGIRAANTATARDPQSSEAYTVLGDLHGQLAAESGLVGKIRHGQRAASSYERAVELDPRNPLAHVGVGITKLETPPMFGGSIQTALEEFRLAQRLDPQCEPAWVWEGIALRRQGALAEARHALKRALRLNPKSRHARRELAALDEEA